MTVETPDNWQPRLSEWFDRLISDIDSGNIKNTPKSPQNSLEVQRCGRYPFCKNYCVDKEYAPYSVCSSRCDSLAESEVDGIQQDND